ncbi:MAG: BrnT family toxin [Synechococcales bacterium]|nr:BrnT family toxin [Synechococcales bacterium]
MSGSGRLLVVSHTDRENRTRIISARRATREILMSPKPFRQMHL